MNTIRILLFRRFRLQTSLDVTKHLEGQKTKELFCYLLIHRHRPHTRDALATLLWQNSSESQAKRYLRQSLWQLQSDMDRDRDSERPLILVDDDWIQINCRHDFWLDVDEFEQAFAEVQGIQGRELDVTKAAKLQQAVQLYRGDLLENWYHDWCLFERERLQNIYLAILDKLVGYCESIQNYDAGKDYCNQILCCEKAHERTFRRLMRLNYHAGDRTSALRLFQRCEQVLRDELGVNPSPRTIELHHQIQTEQFTVTKSARDEQDSSLAATPATLREHLSRLREIRQMLVQAQRQVEEEIESFKVLGTNRS